MYTANRRPRKQKSMQARESSQWLLMKEVLEPSDHLSDHHRISAELIMESMGKVLCCLSAMILSLRTLMGLIQDQVSKKMVRSPAKETRIDVMMLLVNKQVMDSFWTDLTLYVVD